MRHNILSAYRYLKLRDADYFECVFTTSLPLAREVNCFFLLDAYSLLALTFFYCHERILGYIFF